MEDPVEEIGFLVSRLITAPTPNTLRAEVERYFLPTAGFRHPLCLLNRGPQSREALLGIYDWYRALSPGTTGKSRVLAWNEATGLIVVETIQQFHIHFSPFKVANARLVSNVTLERDPDSKLWYIAYQEDFYHPDHFFNLLFPPIVWLIRILLWWGTFASGLFAPLGHAFGLFTNTPPPSFRYTPRAGHHRAESDDKDIDVTIDLNPLHAVGYAFRSLDYLVRARGVRFDVQDVVEPTPGEEELILYGCRPHTSTATSLSR